MYTEKKYWFTDFLLYLQEFEANSDTTTPVTNTLPSPVVARYLRLYPTEYYAYRSLRFDVIGCKGNANMNIIWKAISIIVIK